MTGEIGGGVPLEKDLVRERLQFLPTLFENKFKNAQIISKDGSTTGGSNTLYTVPPNHELWIIHTSFGGHSLTSGPAQITAGNFLIDNGTGNVVHDIYKGFMNESVEDILTYSDTWPWPLQVLPGERVRVTRPSTHMVFWASFTGFLIKKPII